jgi:hypothetical protein
MKPEPEGTTPSRRTRSREPKTTKRPLTPPFPDTPELQEQRSRAAVAQAMIKATRRLLATEGPEWTTTERIHKATKHPERGTPVAMATMRYYFGNRERLLIHVARYEHLLQLGRVRRAFRDLERGEDLPPLLVKLAQDSEHYRVALGLLEASQGLPELADVQRELWADWRAKMRELVADLQQRGLVRIELDPESLALLWSAVTLGLAVHRHAEPGLSLKRVLALAERYASALQ